MFNSEAAPEERLVFDDWLPKSFKGIPFHLVDPQGDRSPNVLLLYSPEGKLPPKMPRTVSIPCNAPAKAIHLLSGISGWGYPYSEKGSVSLIVRLHYDDGKTEDHPLKNGLHFADYIRRVDVPNSEFAFRLRGQQIRYLAVQPSRQNTIRQIELLKGPDSSAPVVMAVTRGAGVKLRPSPAVGRRQRTLDCLRTAVALALSRHIHSPFPIFPRHNSNSPPR